MMYVCRSVDQPVCGEPTMHVREKLGHCSTRAMQWTASRLYASSTFQMSSDGERRASTTTAFSSASGESWCAMMMRGPLRAALFFTWTVVSSHSTTSRPAMQISRSTGAIAGDSCVSVLMSASSAALSECVGVHFKRVRKNCCASLSPMLNCPFSADSRSKCEGPWLGAVWSTADGTPVIASASLNVDRTLFPQSS